MHVIVIRYVACLQGSAGQRFSSFFVGGNPRLKMEEVIYTPGDRFRLHTTSSGTVHLQLGEHSS